MTLIFSDTEQHYVTLMVYRPQMDEALTLLKRYGFSAVSFGTCAPGTAAENIGVLKKEADDLHTRIESTQEQIKTFAASRPDITAAADAYLQEANSDSLLSSLSYTEQTVLLTGWVPEPMAKKVADTLEAQGCAYSLSDPAENDEVPVLMQSGRLADPFTAVTEMYGFPGYSSIIDPSGPLTPFFITFFAFMMGDAAYGVLMALFCYLALRLMKPKGNSKRMFTMFMYCGFGAIVAGALTGGWFSDLTAAFSTAFLGRTVVIPAIWFNPLNAPMKMLIFSLILGFLQIVTSMALSAWRMIRQGHWLDAVFDVGSWYIVFAGLILFVLKVPGGAQTAMFGLALLLLTGGRKSKGLFGKVVGGLGTLYGSIGIMSDLLSYSRIMGLGLSGAVVGQVVNKMAVIGGPGIMGAVMFVLVFLLGHTFNLLISTLGAYVHSSRLQYV
jgi:V/A-type H+-transporting ATPase subunit I